MVLCYHRSSLFFKLYKHQTYTGNQNHPVTGTACPLKLQKNEKKYLAMAAATTIITADKHALVILAHAFRHGTATHSTKYPKQGTDEDAAKA